MHAPAIIPRCLSVRQAGEYLGVGPRKIRTLIQNGKIPLVQESRGRFGASIAKTWTHIFSATK